LTDLQCELADEIAIGIHALLQPCLLDDVKTIISVTIDVPLSKLFHSMEQRVLVCLPVDWGILGLELEPPDDPDGLLGLRGFLRK
jgi:hypothetical protein